MFGGANGGGAVAVCLLVVAVCIILSAGVFEVTEGRDRSFVCWCHAPVSLVVAWGGLINPSTVNVVQCDGLLSSTAVPRPAAEATVGNEAKSPVEVLT